MATAWTRRRAIGNYEKRRNGVFGTQLDNHTTIETVARSSLGINGWALNEFGDEVRYPYDLCLTASTRSHWAADIATTSIVGAGESRKDAAVLPAAASHGQGHSFI